MTTEASPKWIGDQPRTSWAYWVRMNGTPNPKVPREKSTRLPPTSARERNTPSGASGAGERDSMPTKTAVRAPASGEEAERLRAAPAGLGSLDDRVDQRDERGGDRHRARGVEAPLPAARAALGQQDRAQGGHASGDRHVDEEDPLPAEAVT